MCIVINNLIKMFSYTCFIKILKRCHTNGTGVFVLPSHFDLKGSWESLVPVILRESQMRIDLMASLGGKKRKRAEAEEEEGDVVESE